MTFVASPFVENFVSTAESEQLFDYLDRCRKVQAGPSVSLSFENAQTLSFRVQEVQKLRRAYPLATIQRMLGFYASLLPSAERLCAAVSVRRPGARPTPGLNGLGAAVIEGVISLKLGSQIVIGEVMPTRATDRTLGPAFWVSFPLDAAARAALQDFPCAASIGIIADGYAWESERLSFEVRRSLADDLRPHFQSDLFS